MSMSVFHNGLGFLRFTFGLKKFLSHTISIEEAKEALHKGMQQREPAFFKMVECSIFNCPKSPYLKLFQNAGCESGDVKTLLTKEGLEGTLNKLSRAGIFVTLDEFKGRKPALRGSRTFYFRDEDFDNPRITTHYESSTGGSSGKATRIRIDLEHIAQSAPHWAIWFAAHGWLERPLVFATAMHAEEVKRYLRCARFGNRIVKWFVSTGVGTLKGQLAANLVHGVARWAGRFPKPEYTSLQDGGKIAEYLLSLVRADQKPCVLTSPSEAVRICLAATNLGSSLRNVTFLVGSEPLTAARRNTIEAAGANASATYGFSEGGSLGSQCPNVPAVDDVHIFMDAYALIQCPRTIQNGNTVEGVLITALGSACPKVLLNIEIGDYGFLETKRCGCLFDEFGFFQHLHTIRSYDV